MENTEFLNAMWAKMKAKMDATQEKMDALQERMEAKMKETMEKHIRSLGSIMETARKTDR
jgi:uncharacterized coiled-coil protein SlyX